MSSPQHGTPYSLPPTLTPESIETLPILSTILARLSIPSSTPANSSQTSPPPPTPSQPPTSAANATGPLTLKDIPLATDSLKHKIQRARAEAKSLPDVDRSIEEQEMEMRELDKKIEKQKEVLRMLAELGRGARIGREQVMET